MPTSDKWTLPTNLAEITPAHLTAILDRAVHLGPATVEAVRVEPIAQGSYNAQLARLHLSYSDPPEQAVVAQAPRTLIAKLPIIDTALHEYAGVFQPGSKDGSSPRLRDYVWMRSCRRERGAVCSNDFSRSLIRWVSDLRTVS